MKIETVKRYILDSIMLGYLLTVLLVVIYQPSEEQTLDLSTNASLFAGLVFVGGLISWIANSSGRKTLGEVIFEPAHQKVNRIEYPWYQSFSGLQTLVFVVVTLAVGFHVTQFSVYKLIDKESLEPTLRLFSGLFDPNWQILPRAVLKMIETIFLAFLATALAIPVAFLLCFFCAKNIMKHPVAFVVYMLLRTLFNFMRSIEAFVWAIIFSVWVGIGPFAGMLALMIHSIASLAKQYSEIVETVDEGPIEGIESTGASKLQIVWFAVVPQVILPFISFTIYRWDINIRMATIVGFVGGGGIGSLLQTYQGQAMWQEVGTIIMVIAFVVWFMDTASAYIREALK